jgi:hypothetical protein
LRNSPEAKFKTGYSRGLIQDFFKPYRKQALTGNRVNPVFLYLEAVSLQDRIAVFIPFKLQLPRPAIGPWFFSVYGSLLSKID